MIDASRYQFISFAQDRGVLTVRLNRPDAMNAINAGLHTELSTVFADIAADRSVLAVVLTGEGRGFCGGGDLAWFRDITAEQLDALFFEARKIIIDLLELPQPLIAAVNGHAAGLGATLALFCDVIFVAEQARIADPHVRVGVAAGDGGAVIWAQRIGLAKAKEYLLTGDLLTAQKAAEIGLINHCVPLDELDAAVDAFCDRLLAGAMGAIRATKVLTNLELKRLATAVMDAGIAYESVSVRSADHLEGIAALREKRAPQFTGR